MIRSCFALALALTGCAAAEPAPQVATQVAARPDPDGFLFFNDAALYRSAMARCTARLPDYADELADAERSFADASIRYAARGGDPERADLERLYARSDRELAADFARRSDVEVETACRRLAPYHRGNMRAYRSAGNLPN